MLIDASFAASDNDDDDECNRSSRAYIVFSIERKYRCRTEYAAKECYNKDSPLLADVLLAVSLPTSKIGNTKSVQRLILVISTVFGMLMNTGYQELSLQLVSSKDNRNDFS
ncbi:hypothetical protein DPMN_113513 [Dreissena polymorpha]|uniref:Uncharacterized protein n=1 Tax=Dreissena polymorpha TaxID=45954 RepID=A0A9D4KJ71_DREPO|nr:hypothetical protein DPMN_113513 [Dreissena polymorpha]